MTKNSAKTELNPAYDAACVLTRGIIYSGEKAKVPGAITCSFTTPQTASFTMERAGRKFSVVVTEEPS